MLHLAPLHVISEKKQVATAPKHPPDQYQVVATSGSPEWYVDPRDTHVAGTL